MSEIEAILALRTRNTSISWARRDEQEDHTKAKVKAKTKAQAKAWYMSSSPQLRKDVEEMVRRGWRRSRADFDQVKRNVWAANDRVVERLLRDL